MGTVLKRSSFSWLRQQRVRSAARQSFCRASTSPQGTAYSHGVMSSESCSPPALPRLLVVRHRVLLPMRQPPAVKLCWLLYRLAWTWQLPVWPRRNEMPLIFSSCRCWAEDAQCYLHQGSLQGSFGVVSVWEWVFVSIRFWIFSLDFAHSFFQSAALSNSKLKAACSCTTLGNTAI